MKLSKRANQKGFTLVELAIVLVIIGLIVGGVLAGQDLIKAATIRAASNQISQYDTEALAFQNKYNGLPGDLLYASANSNFGVTNTNTATVSTGDGDGLISSASAASTLCAGTCIGGENSVFFYELLKAGLNSDPVTNADVSTYTLAPNTAVPNSKLGASSEVAVQSSAGQNFYVIANFGGATALAAGGSATANAFKPAVSPLAASQLDAKMDDGAPTTGRVLSILPAAGATGAATVPSTAYTTTYAAAQCATSATAYSTAGASGTSLTCGLSIRASF